MVATCKKDIYVIEKQDMKIYRKFKFEDEVRAAYCIHDQKYLLIVFHRGHIAIFKLFKMKD